MREGLACRARMKLAEAVLPERKTMLTDHFYINGAWVAASNPAPHPVYNPSTEEAFTSIAWAEPSEVDRAVEAARLAFDGWSVSKKEHRLDALNTIISIYERRRVDIGQAISQEMGAPIDMAVNDQVGLGLRQLKGYAEALKGLSFDRLYPNSDSPTIIAKEAIGVAGLITPWNWPMNQVALKVGGALAAGCTMVLKPSEIAPLSSILFAEVMHEAGVPAGVFNLVHGDGAGVGTQLSTHPQIDIMSFTGSTRAGVAITKAAADTVKRVTLELGGKSPNVIFADADIERLAVEGAQNCFHNTGQTCTAPTRMLVERPAYARAVELAGKVGADLKVSVSNQSGDHMGPLVSQAQFDKVQALIETGISEGAQLVAGGTGRPEHLNRGWFVRPTVFSDVSRDMTIWREEIFGPVLVIVPFDSEAQAIELANDTPYGLAAYVQTADPGRLQRVCRGIRAGVVEGNGGPRPRGVPFGGYKFSGNGREGGAMGIEEFLETKTICGWPADS